MNSPGRAYLNGKMDLLQAEAVADLIHSKSEKARLAAAHQLRGVLSERIKKIREPLVTLLAHIEANLDFVEEDIPIVERTKIIETLGPIEIDLKQLISTAVQGRWLREGVKVALAGKPNVGKSSLFNALLAEDRAIVTDIPGTTRDTLEERLQWDGIPFVLTDTAGLRDTGDVVESQGTERARRAHQNADIVLVVVDASEPIRSEDKAIVTGLHDRRAILALNKSDRGIRINLSDLPSVPYVETSAVSGKGLNELKNKLVQAVSRPSGESEDAGVVTNLRHLHHLETCAAHLEKARTSLQRGRTEESVSMDFREALNEIGKITGDNVTDDVLTSIFSQFCIGK